MKRLIILLAFSILVVPDASAGGWIKTLSAAQKKAKESNQIIFVDLYADWCGWCHRLEQEVFPSQAFQTATKDMVLLRLNTEDGADGSKLAHQLQVTSLPTSLLVTSDLTIAGLIRGYAPPSEFAKSISEAETKYGVFVQKVKQESSFGSDYKKRLDLAHEFRDRMNYAASEQRLRKIVADSKAPAEIRDQAYYDLALSQFFQSHFEDTMKTLARFASLQSKGEAFERSRLLIGDVYVAQGNVLGAVNEYKHFKKTFPASPFIRNIDMVLPQMERQLAAGR